MESELAGADVKIAAFNSIEMCSAYEIQKE